MEDALSKEQLADVAAGLFRQNSASCDRDLSWMLVAAACLSRAVGMRHTRLADLCHPAPVNGVGERLGLPDSCRAQGLDSMADCAALLGVMGSLW